MSVSFWRVTRDVLEETQFFSWEHWIVSLHNAIKLFPLIAAVIAPLSVLLDIPALSQPWYGHEGQRITDEKTSLILSAVSLFCNVVANALLLLRFSIVSRAGYTRATRISMIFWILKAGVALTNLIIFGVYRNNEPGYEYLEGFWCAVLSCVLASISALMLLSHYLYEFDPAVALKHNEVRLRGRTFMINVTLLVVTLGIQGLIFSKIEHWTYLDGIYFSTVSILTVGFGDFSPATTAGKIVLFPTVLLGIAQLGVCVSEIIGYFGSKSSDVTKAIRYHVRQERLREEMKMDALDIAQEMKFLEEADEAQAAREDLIRLIKSVSSFLALWLIGALIFSKLESWTYGNGLYFNYVFFLTLGYGDWSPKTSAGRVVFIVYALISVPIITSFAVQSITQAMSLLSARGILKRTKKLGEDHSPISHHALLEEASEDLARGEEEKSLHDMLIDSVLQMDLATRKLLSVTLKGRPRLVLKADTIVQLRNTTDEFEHYIERFHEVQIDQELSNYRRQFARFLTSASSLKELRGEEQRLFERRVKERLRQSDSEEARSESSASISSSHSNYILDHERQAEGRVLDDGGSKGSPHKGQRTKSKRTRNAANRDVEANKSFSDEEYVSHASSEQGENHADAMQSQGLSEFKAD